MEERDPGDRRKVSISERAIVEAAITFWGESDPTPG